jgi:DNA helicase HerA-like ATPase
MKIYKKQGDTIQILCSPEETVEKGDYLHIEDKKVKKGLIVQVIDIQFANLPGILEDMLRDVITEDSIKGYDCDPFNISSQIETLKDTRLLVCKIRGSMENGKAKSEATWLPSRTNSRIALYPIEKLASTKNGKRPMTLGRTRSSSLTVDVKMLDGKLNIITGKKGVGKSHLSKLIILSLIRNGAPCLVFDVNGEYVNIGRSKNNEPNPEADKISVMTPGQNLRLGLKSVGLKTLRTRKNWKTNPTRVQ